MNDENGIEMEAMLFEKKILPSGYIKIKIQNRWVFEHIWICEQYIQRELTEKERVHHIDGNKQRNVLSNLWIFPSDKEHIQFHVKLKRFRYYTQPMLTAMEHRWDKYLQDEKNQEDNMSKLQEN